MLGELSALAETLRRLQCGLAAEPEEIAVGIAAALHLVEAALAVWMCGQYVLFLDPEEHTSELQSLMRISYAVFCLKKKKKKKITHNHNTTAKLLQHTQYILYQ